MSTTMSPLDPPELDLADLDLIERTLVVEASAGTGKTHAIAALTTRALAERFCTIDQVMLVTFTVRAAGELRSRVHQSLLEGIQVLADPDHEPSGVLRGVWRGRRSDALAALQAAVADFDRATISTTHQFSRHMLTTLGVLADHDVTATSRESLDDLVQEVHEDLYLRRLGHDAAPLRPDGLEHLLETTLGSHLHVPIADSDDPRTLARRALVEEARDDFETLKRVRQQYSFDDMVGRLNGALKDPVSGPLAADLLSGRYRLVMVDEFQDTGLLQWEIIRHAFDGRSLLVLIGDPKQAIYRFRGADVHAYLAAAHAHERVSLRHNWRSSQAVLDGVDAILRGAQLGDGIATLPAMGRPGGLVGVGGDWRSPAELRLLEGSFDRWRALDEIAADVARVLVDLFDQQERRVLLPGDDPARPARRLRARDVAVLTRTNHAASVMARALARAGVPAVVSDRGAVLREEAGTEWQLLLATLLDVDVRGIRRLSLTRLVGWTLPQLMAADDDEFGALAQSVRELSQLWVTRGFATMSDALVSRFRLHERLLPQPGGPEQLSDLLHVAELIQHHSFSHRATPEATLRWLERAIEAGEGGPRRAGSDENAVQVMTIHAAKGLGFPIVLAPDLWDVAGGRGGPKDLPRLVHRHEDGVEIAELDVARDANQDTDPEALPEDLRLAYVAMTRANVALKLWWAQTGVTGFSPLHALLVHEHPGQVPLAPGRLRSDAVQGLRDHLATPRFAPLRTTWVPATDAPVAESREPDERVLRHRSWTRRIDHTWRRTSYTGLTAALHDLAPDLAGGHDEPEVAAPEAERDDELATPDVALPGDADRSSAVGVPASAVAAPDRGTPSPMAAIGGSAEFGVLVHAILEHVDPQAPDLRAAIAAHAAPHLAAFGGEVDRAELTDALVRVFETPLGRLTGGTLRDLPASDRLAELDFELTMGTSAPGRAATVGALAALFGRRDLLPSDDPLADYGDLLGATPAADQVLNGFLTGSIDAVLRVPRHDESDARYVVVDYKTNTMPLEPGEILTVEHYNASAMGRAMRLAHYPLQALLYSVALHRFLGWRLPGYDPSRHLGGVGYLFVRGMAGADTPELGGMPAGVFTWQPPAAFILEADAILGGRR